MGGDVVLDVMGWAGLRTFANKKPNNRLRFDTNDNHFHRTVRQCDINIRFIWSLSWRKPIPSRCHQLTKMRSQSNLRTAAVVCIRLWMHDRKYGGTEVVSSFDSRRLKAQMEEMGDLQLGGTSLDFDSL
ncbi:hypothetical protein MJO29_012106 [Puccinia striiformis f. sp. tritici]|uniref:Uncharacterized protein n=1 Tax=Puccinia striiformis TaxID=27350 RepID=A0A2S4WJY7_9BASI|nr:hypothetical protein MJO29_012106 [Puccinia striiformis f. sp. tritici]POW22069.1 hypothetical protein PSHT_01611 [Puccinia striiformis]